MLVVIDLIFGQLAGVGAVAQHQDAVGQLLDLAQPVRDVDHRNPFGPELPDGPKQVPGLALGEARRGLVHDQDPGPCRQRPGDLHQLPLAHGEPGDLGGGRAVQSDPFQNRPGRPLQPAMVDEPEAMGFPAQEDVGRHVQIVREIQFLVYEDHAQTSRGRDRVHLDGRSIHEDLSRVGGFLARQDLDQGALAGSVFAHQGQDLAGVDLEVRTVQGQGPRKSFADLPGFEDRCRHEWFRYGAGNLAGIRA